MSINGFPMTFQQRVQEWLMACFSMEVCRDRRERNHRFLEEALELVQALDCSRSEAHQLVDYVFDRAVGEPAQELGGVMVTLAALCFPNDLDMVKCSEAELSRVWANLEKIRAKQAAKPRHSPLPGSPNLGAEFEVRLSSMLIGFVRSGVPRELVSEALRDYADSIRRADI